MKVTISKAEKDMMDIVEKECIENNTFLFLNFI